jgi:hypothetical protein
MKNIVSVQIKVYLITSYQLISKSKLDKKCRSYCACARFCCNKVYRCPWNQKALSEQHVSMTPEKLKAHKDFGHGNKFQGSSKLLVAQDKQKSVGLPA